MGHLFYPSLSLPGGGGGGGGGAGRGRIFLQSINAVHGGDGSSGVSGVYMFMFKSPGDKGYAVIVE